MGRMQTSLISWRVACSSAYALKMSRIIPRWPGFCGGLINTD